MVDEFCDIVLKVAESCDELLNEFLRHRPETADVGSWSRDTEKGARQLAGFL
jgi:hypothetical protein